jgi:hypothetical protein
MAATVHELRITLDDVKPRIWRTFVVPSGIPLAALHRVIQSVMGWEDSHLHRFEINGVGYEILMPGLDQEADTQDASKAVLGELVPNAGAGFVYQYDFGDNWVHRVEVLTVGLPSSGAKYPICTGGERACPPEDCGGVGGFEVVLDALAHPGREESKELLVWLGRGYDPAAFDLAKVNRRLNSLRTRFSSRGTQKGG